MAASLPSALRAGLDDFGADLSSETRFGFKASVRAERSRALLGRLHSDPEIAMCRLVDLTAIDRGRDPERFEVVYCLHSPSMNERIRIHVGVEADEPIVDSVIEIWPGSNWLEREVFDLFGIGFRGHPDLRRILLESDFEGAPLRKDYPRQPNLALPKTVQT